MVLFASVTILAHKMEFPAFMCFSFSLFVCLCIYFVLTNTQNQLGNVQNVHTYRLALVSLGMCTDRGSGQLWAVVLVWLPSKCLKRENPSLQCL